MAARINLTTRISDVETRLDTLEGTVTAGFDRLAGMIGSLTPEAPAKVTARKAPAKKRASRKPAAKKAAPRKGSVIKSAQTKAQLGRKGWNDTFSALVRTSGLRFGPEQVSLYRASMDRWTLVSAERDAGRTPAEVVDLVIQVVKADLV